MNAYVSEARMTQDVDLISTRAEALSQELKEHLSQQFHVAIRIRKVSNASSGRNGEICSVWR